MVLLSVDGFALPVSMFVGVPEALAIVYSNGMDFRRPTTTDTWIRSIQVHARVVVFCFPVLQRAAARK